MWQRLWSQSSWSMWHHRSQEVEEFPLMGAWHTLALCKAEQAAKSPSLMPTVTHWGLIHMLIVFPHKKAVLLQCKSRN